MRSHGEGDSEKSEYHIRFKDEDEVNVSWFSHFQKEAWRSQLERAILRSSAMRGFVVPDESSFLSLQFSGGRSRAFSVFLLIVSWKWRKMQIFWLLRLIWIHPLIFLRILWNMIQMNVHCLVVNVICSVDCRFVCTQFCLLVSEDRRTLCNRISSSHNRYSKGFPHNRWN